ncbi:2'-5' RNA ligase family protein [Streptomyces sp. NBC_00335]|uniref:2'-5' RNA ligase family protein n=1 Tax=unclassified Streptomyces TaxID=2593676 RepID=UPI00225BC392|nr:MULTISPECIES: 2'-5' RNA ligase family protein [unclassified Streptomyces]MCX5404221.1 2'-5' RNA ligase family protein [Streptomyces sp. NBC_00086]
MKDTADDTTSSMFPAGRTALIVRIPEAEPAVRDWRDRIDPAARAGAGVPAHVSVLYPFLPESLIDPSVHARIAAALRPHPAFDLRFERTGRFPGMLYLAPEPDAPLRRLTRAVAEHWPEVRPYGGRYPDPVPHLTVAQRAREADLDAAEAALRGRLPLTTRVRAVDLVAYDGTAWHERASFPLREPGE